MNFMSGRPGFYEEIISSRGMSSPSSASSPSSSSSSSLHHRPTSHQLSPYTTYHHQQEAYLPPPPPESSSPTNNGGGDEDSDVDHMLALRRGGEGSSAGAAPHVVIEREHMFDKVVTPSDVGKLNRLVIPKQHAEKYFPLDSSTNEKGLLLNFEDRNGKPWRFRYSYWNSSQSYVMTKGWSRFVKEKKLDAGDIVSFQRGVGEVGKDRLFIDWRRRPDAPELPPTIPTLSIPHQFSLHRSSIHSWNPLFLQPPSSRDYSHLLQANPIMNTSANHHHHHLSSGGGGGGYNSSPYGYSNVVNGNPCPPGSIVYLRSAAPLPPGGGGGSGGFSCSPVAAQQYLGLGGMMGGGGQRGSSVGRGGGGVGIVHHHEEMQVFESVPVVQGKAAAKRLRLFGVNMDCPISESDECDILHPSSATTITFPQYPPLLDHSNYPNNYNNNSTSSIIPLFQSRPNYGGGGGGADDDDNNDDKGKGSMSLDLDI